MCSYYELHKPKFVLCTADGLFLPKYRFGKLCAILRDEDMLITLETQFFSTYSESKQPQEIMD